MKFKLLTSIFAFVLICNSYAVSLNNHTIVDMSYPFNKDTIYWPTEKGFDLQTVFYGITPKKYFYTAFKFCTPEHGGTHVDAPRHFSEKGLTVDQIPPSQLMGNAVVINVDKQAQKDRDYAVTEEDIRNFEKQYRPLNDQDIVLFYTGWGQYWHDKKKYLGSDKFGDVKNLHFPGISKQAAEYLVTRKIKGIGIDTASMDPGNSLDFWTHRILLGANLYGIENLAQLHLLPPVGASIIVAPMKISGGSGGAARVFATGDIK